MQVYSRNTQYVDKPNQYGAVMIKECARYKMKPICDYYGWCQNDARTLYLGQTNGYFMSQHATYKSVFPYFPAGWKAIAANFGGDPAHPSRSNGPNMNYYDHCFYYSASSTTAYCGTYNGGHSSYRPYQYAGFMCGAVNYKTGVRCWIVGCGWVWVHVLL